FLLQHGEERGARLLGAGLLIGLEQGHEDHAAHRVERREIDIALFAVGADQRARQTTPSWNERRRRRLAALAFDMLRRRLRRVQHRLFHAKPWVDDLQVANAGSATWLRASVASKGMQFLQPCPPKFPLAL